MKKYIIMAIISLMGLGSCVVGGGDIRSMRDYGKSTLAEQVVNAVVPIVQYYQFAIYGELLLSGAQTEAEFIKNTYFPGARIFEEGTTIVLLVGKDRYTQYELRTDGELLSEGGLWQLVQIPGAGATETLGTIEGIVGESRRFKFGYDDFPHRYYYDYASCDISADIEYVIDLDKESVALEITGGGVIGEKGEFETAFEIDADQPLLYVRLADSAGYVGGKISALYTDFEYKNTKSVVVTYDETGKYFYE